ncbi:hypothetical protein PsorP6_001887 [Peronosclerospora sorghi]|uniref:Uncharacterized protein n=1 Tax=Peronosclerospora sorghi TaxID=230839 RepID=A0ACC0WSN7_9STRA|nr:hypothetical protein PsorP6_001887 [Peronosclerospora sorghi]
MRYSRRQHTIRHIEALAEFKLLQDLFLVRIGDGDETEAEEKKEQLRRALEFCSTLHRRALSMRYHEPRGLTVEREGGEGYFPRLMRMHPARFLQKGEEYFNRKHSYALNVLGICDPHSCIRYAYVRFPGSVHDSRVFSDTPVAQTPNVYFSG